MHLLAHGADYGYIVFSPYLFWTTTVCMPLVADHAVVVPCLHDEPYAHLEVIRPVLRDPASVWFLSEPEHELAHRLGPVASHHVVTGAGVHVPESYDADGFRSRHGITRPFVLYAGRREHGKGWDWLLSCYAAALESHDPGIDLVTIGAGEVDVPVALKDRVIDLGFLDVAERDSALAAAAASVQPSIMESFRAPSSSRGWRARRCSPGRTVKSWSGTASGREEVASSKTATSWPASCGGWPTPRRRPSRLPRPAGATCSSTTPGLSCSTGLKRSCSEREAGGRAPRHTGHAGRAEPRRSKERGVARYALDFATAVAGHPAHVVEQLLIRDDLPPVGRIESLVAAGLVTQPPRLGVRGRDLSRPFAVRPGRAAGPRLGPDQPSRAAGRSSSRSTTSFLTSSRTSTCRIRGPASVTRRAWRSSGQLTT